MASYTPPRPSLWSHTGPSGRLVFGVFLITVVGLWGLTPKTVFGVVLAWPHAALWGAVGWGRVGLSMRVVALLIVFGLLQDITFNAPLGCFVIVNLIVYGLSTAAASTFDMKQDTLMSFIVPAGLFFVGFFVLWILASSFADHAVRVMPLLAYMLATGLTYVLVADLFDLGRRPGTLSGSS